MSSSTNPLKGNQELKNIKKKRALGVLSSSLVMASIFAMNPVSDASSHRDAPLISEDPVADNTDVYAFVAPDAPDSVTLISNFIPLQEPASGPNFHNFGEDVLYEIKIDNDGDADVDYSYQFNFTTDRSGADNGPGGADDTPLINEGTITFEGGEYKNLNVKQTYKVTEVGPDGSSTELAAGLVVPPPNIGPRSTPNYEALAAAGVHEVSEGGDTMKVFAGQRDETFPVDLGSIFDLGALRSLNEVHLAAQLPSQQGGHRFRG